jgi:hypothetical protein
MHKLINDEPPLTQHFTADIAYVSAAAAVTINSNLFPGGLHLGNSKIIGSMYIENNANNTQLQFTFGPNVAPPNEGGLYVVNAKTWRRYAFPTGITSVSVQAITGDTGIVLVILSTEIWKPGMGVIV